jgi:hypothetical protein
MVSGGCLVVSLCGAFVVASCLCYGHRSFEYRRHAHGVTARDGVQGSMAVPLLIRPCVCDFVDDGFERYRKVATVLECVFVSCRSPMRGPVSFHAVVVIRKRIMVRVQDLFRRVVFKNLILSRWVRRVNVGFPCL